VMYVTSFCQIFPSCSVPCLGFVLPAATFRFFLLHQCPKRQECLQIVPSASPEENQY
jgi:hypothetical protein